jgi:hypothetical protein
MLPDRLGNRTHRAAPWLPIMDERRVDLSEGDTRWA